MVVVLVVCNRKSAGSFCLKQRPKLIPGDNTEIMPAGWNVTTYIKMMINSINMANILDLQGWTTSILDMQGWATSFLDLQGCTTMSSTPKSGPKLHESQGCRPVKNLWWVRKKEQDTQLCCCSNWKSESSFSKRALGLAAKLTSEQIFSVSARLLPTESE